MANSAWKIKVGVELDTSEIDAKLQEKQSKLTVKASGAEEVGKLGKATEEADNKAKAAGLTYQQYRLILDNCAKAITSMAEQTKKLDSTQTEFKKVSDLSGKSLDDYTKKLANMGKQVGRSG